MDQVHIYIMQILFVGGITYGSQSWDLKDKHNWGINIARYVIYVLAVRGANGACVVMYDSFRHKRAVDAQLLRKLNRHHVMLFVASIAYLLLNDQGIIDGSFPLFFLASLLAKYPEIKKTSSVIVNYGVGMACSYFEGYLVHVLPSDGAKFFGFEENIRAYEASQGVVFPVKKLFVIVPKSLYSPPALKDFNKSNREDIAKLEACNSLSEVEKDVAGVKNRIYKNAAYKIYRAGARPVCVCAECGTPLHTMYNVMKNRILFEELSGLNQEEVVAEFLSALRNIISRSPECRGKCELIYFDDRDENLNLADILLDRIRELEPNFEEIIAQGARN